MTANETLAWTIPIGDCGIKKTQVGSTEVHHVIYMNPPASSAHVMRQVKFTCKHETGRAVSNLTTFSAWVKDLDSSFEANESSNNTQIVQEVLVNRIAADFDIGSMVE